MGWATEMEVLLIVLVFSKWLLTTDALLQESPLAGRPLSDAEYESFFQTLAARHVFHAVCLRRAILGCYDPAIQALDRYENHGVVPHGWICSDLPDNTSFPGFCDFALYRCSMKKYFAKRVLCPDETTQKATVTQTNQEGIPDDTVISTQERSFELPDSTPTTSTESSPEPLNAPAAAAVEISAMPPPTATAKTPLLKLLSSSAVDMASKLVSQIVAAFSAATKPLAKPPTSEPFVELTPSSAATATPEAPPKLTTPMAEEFLMELTSTAPELNTATMSAPTQATITAPTESLPELATATPEATPKLTTPMAEEFLTELTSTVAIITEPELNLAKTAPIEVHTEATITAPTESFPEFATATPEASSTLTTPMAEEFLIEFTSTAAVITEPELNLATTATIEAHTEATITAPTESFPELATATPEASSKLTTPMTEEFLIEFTSTAAVITEPELNKATAATIAAPTEARVTAPTEFFPEFATATPEASSMLTTPMAEEFLIEFTSTAAVITEPELNLAKMATIAAPTEARITAPTEFFPELATATPEASSKLTTPMTEEFLIEFTSTAAVITEPELNLATAATIAAPTEATITASTESFLELATAMELFPESTSGTIPHTTTTTEPCIVDYPEPLNVSPNSTSSTEAASSASLLPLHTATTATAPPQPFVPGFGAPLPFPPLQSNSTMRILILSFIGNKNVKSGDMAGITALPQAALGSGNILQQEGIQSPHPTNGLKDFFLRLRDKNVQQLMDKIQNGISGGEQKPKLLSNSLQLLSALNPRSNIKKRLQR